MGSLPSSSDWQFPATELPMFNTTTEATNITSYHKVTQDAVPVRAGGGSTMTQFAQFVAAVVGRPNIAFLANTHSGLSVINATVTKEVVEATPLEYTENDSSLSFIGFAISTVCHQPLELLQPFILSLRYTGEVVDITVALRASHGPEAAAQQLLRLATSYLTSAPNFSNTQKSVIVAPINAPVSLLANTPSPILLHEILGQAAVRYGGNIAIDEVTGRKGSIYTRRQITYTDLHSKVAAFADEIEEVLQKLNWPLFNGEQRMVPIFMPNSTELNICMNAISKTGHSFCALQLDAPEKRIHDLLQDLRAPGILGLGPNPFGGTALGEQIIWIDYHNAKACLVEYPQVVQIDRPIPPRRIASPGDLAYIMYTSGSSGKPKGVKMQHSAAIAFLNDMETGPAPLPVGPSFRWMVMSAPTFDIVLMDNFMALKKGGTVCLSERSLLLTQPEAIIHELRATATFTVTSLAMLLRPDRIPTMSWIAVGGELLGQRIVDNFATDGSDHETRQLVCVYGPTEATVFITNHICDKKSRPSVIGQPLPNLTLVVLDMESAKPRAVPMGVVGELAVAGPQLSSGYLNRPKETAQAFIEKSEFGRLYRTGDKVRFVWTEDGKPRLDYLGRLSTDQVKLNGRRVDLPEIENTLSQVNGVAQAAALVSNSKLVACVMTWQDAKNAADITTRCRIEASNQLPAYMCPVQYHLMDKLPLSVNGKVDRRALAAILDSEGGLDDVVITYERDAVAATGSQNAEVEDTSSMVRSALAHVLGDVVSSQPDTASLVQLGLDSLCALIVVQRLTESGIEPPDLHDILGSHTISDLIDVIEKSRAAQHEPLGVAVECSQNPEPMAVDIPVLRDPIGGDGIDVSKIEADDDEIVFGLSVNAKLRHFEYHCRARCLDALQLKDEQVEQVLPTTNVQTRFVAAAVDPVIYNPAKFVGRPQITHFPYNVPMDLDPARFQRAIEAVLPRYDCFRTVFTPIEHPLAPFAQCILAPSAASIPKTEVICDDTNAESRDSLWMHTVLNIQRAAENYMTIDKPGIAMAWVWSPNRARCTMIMTLFHGIYDGTQICYLWDAVLAEYDNPGSL
ncbi:hypothetical protein NQ176_g7092 [Zarea fungicola]|uniref:Uncharacterized protein n=1 Tax=Zarea fungicola TaxID=93591 RepID=A0ACC1N280_9HYPO|nr:hypothetical protein NQ176_g7092 [Lecanicillium fungicola]